jgi:general secretion pathway protein J
MHTAVISTRRGDAGYALIELLIALAILAMILAMVPSTLKLGQRAWQTSSQLNDNPAAAAMVFTSDTLRSALPYYVRDRIGMTRIMFVGEPDRMSFVAELAHGPSGGGLYRIDAGAIAQQNGPAVSLTLLRDTSENEAAPLDVRSLVGTYRAVEFRYFGVRAKGGKAEWASSWTRTDRLPDLVDIAAHPHDGQLQPLFTKRTELMLRPVL